MGVPRKACGKDGKSLVDVAQLMEFAKGAQARFLGRVAKQLGR